MARSELSTLARKAVLLPAASLAILLQAAPVAAQSVDYSGFEQLLGEPVTTSATGKPQRMSEVPANMEIITADDIRRSGADNLPDILKYVAGLDVRRYGFAAADVGIRGYNQASNPRLLVLLNGQQVYLDDVGRTQWYTLPVQLDEIRQIEIVKGPNTALFGFNAASGVINIITYDPASESVNTATARAGTQGYTALSAVGTGKIADVGGLRLAADGFRAQEFAPANVSPLDLPFRQSPERNALSFDARVQAAPNVQVFASGAIVQTRTWEPTTTPFYQTDSQRTDWARVGLNADTDYGLIGLSVYRNELQTLYRGAREDVDVKDTVLVVQANDLVKLGPYHTIRVNLDYRNNAATSSVIGGRVGYEVFSGGAMWDWQMTPALSLTTAARLDHFVLNQQGTVTPVVGFPASAYNGRTLNEPSFNAGLVWKATEADTIRLLAARGLQLPSILDLGVQFRLPPGPFTPGFLFLGNPDVHAATIHNAELDWDHTLPAINSTLRAAVFAQRTDDIIASPFEAMPGFDGLIVGGLPELRAVAGNIGHSTAVGGEIGLRGHAESGLRWNASYSFISINDHLSINPGLFSAQNFAQGTPTHVIVLGGGYSVGKWEFDVEGRWQSWYLDYRGNAATGTLVPTQIGNYLTADARVGYRVTDNITAAVSAQQFNVSHLTVTEGPPVERRIFLSLTVHL